MLERDHKLDTTVVNDGKMSPAEPESWMWIWIDPASVCNLSCRLCYTRDMQSKGQLSESLFRSIIDSIQNSKRRIAKLHLNWIGEPLANPAFTTLLNILNRSMPGQAVEWHTNATLITPCNAQRIVDSNPNQHIFLSLDGGDAESFDANRGDGAWNRALRGALSLFKARSGRQSPRIGIYQLDLGVKAQDYDRRFARLLGMADEHRTIQPIRTDGSVAGDGARHPIEHGPCFWLGHTLAIDARGRAFTCLLERRMLLGSIPNQTVDSLLDRAREMRLAVDKYGRSCMAGCASCRKLPGVPAVPELSTT